MTRRHTSPQIRQRPCCANARRFTSPPCFPIHTGLGLGMRDDRRNAPKRHATRVLLDDAQLRAPGCNGGNFYNILLKEGLQGGLFHLMRAQLLLRRCLLALLLLQSLELAEGDSFCSTDLRLTPNLCSTTALICPPWVSSTAPRTARNAWSKVLPDAT